MAVEVLPSKVLMSVKTTRMFILQKHVVAQLLTLTLQQQQLSN